MLAALPWQHEVHKEAISVLRVLKAEEFHPYYFYNGVLSDPGTQGRIISRIQYGLLLSRGQCFVSYPV